MRLPHTATIVAVLLSTLALPFAAWGQEDLGSEIEALKQGQQQIRNELAEIKKLLQQRPSGGAPAPAAQKVTLDLSGRPSQGDEGAKLTLVEFSDYQCPYCGRHVTQTHPQIQEQYIDTGKVRHVFLDLPLESIHKQAFKAAEAAHCAGEQDKYWEMHDRLFANQKSLEPWSGHAEALGLDVATFDSCLEGGKYGDQVRSDLAQARRVGASGTPTFFLAYTGEDDSKTTTEVRLRGAQPFTAFQAEIDRLLENGEADG